MEPIPINIVEAKVEVQLKTESKIDDTFVSHRSSHRNSITSKGNYSIFPPSYIKETPVRERSMNTPLETTRRSPNAKTETDTENQRETWCLPIQHPGPLPPSKNASGSGRSRSATTPSTTRIPKTPVTPKETSTIKPTVPSQTFNFQIPLTKAENLPKPGHVDCNTSLQGQLPSFDHAFIARLPEARHSISSMIEDSPTLARTAPGFGLDTSAYKVPPKVFKFEKKPEPSFTRNLPEILAELGTSSVKQPLSIKARKQMPDKPDSPYLNITTPPQTPPQDIPRFPSKSSLKAPTPQHLPSTPDSLRPPTPPTITRVPSKNRLSSLLNTLPPLPTKTPQSDDFGYATITPTAMRYKTFKLPKRSGSATPPETPDPLPRLGLYPGPFQPAEFPAFNVGAESERKSVERRSPERKSIQRKPVPIRRSSDECDHVWAMRPTGPSPTAVRNLLGSPVMRRPAAENLNWPIRVEGASLTTTRNRAVMSVSEKERMELNCVRGVGLPRLRKRMLRQMLGMKSRVDVQTKHGFPSFI